MSKKLLAFAVAVMMIVTSFGVSAAESSPVEIQDSPDAMILFTNDVHCGIEDGWGYAGVSEMKKVLELMDIPTLLVDAGDHVQGGPIGTLSRGSYIVDIMNFVDYDLAIPGNHEFDYGMDRFFELVEQANYTYIASNFMHYENGAATSPVFDAYKIFEIGGMKIAFVGICTPETITKSTPTYFQNANGEYIYGFCQDDNGNGVVAAAQAAIDAAKTAGADHVVVIGHCGTDEQSSPWTSTELIGRLHGIDAFIDGHSHSVICSEVQDADGNPVLHGQTGTKLANIGMLGFYSDGRVAMDMAASTENDVTDQDTQDYIDSIKAQYEELLAEVIAYTPHDLTVNDPDTDERAVRSKETNLGDLCADAYRTMLDADIAFVNGGGVRANLKSGEITFGDVLNVHPFGNEACLVEVTGQQILDALELGSRVCPDENGGFLQVSGLTYEIHTDMPANVIVGDDKMWQGPAGIPYRVQNVMIMDRQSRGYKPLDLNKTYTLASHNYMLKSQGDGFAMFGTENVNIVLDEVMIDNAVLINYISTMEGGTANGKEYDHIIAGYQDPRGDGRITIVGSTQPTPDEPTAAPVEPTAAPVEPTSAPVEPTAAPVEPTPSPVPVPPTGTIAIAGIGSIAMLSGAVAVLFRKKDEQ